jgi:hypothetical protein
VIPLVVMNPPFFVMTMVNICCLIGYCENRYMETTWRYKLLLRCIIVLSTFTPTALVCSYLFLPPVNFTLSKMSRISYNAVYVLICIYPEPINIFQGSYNTDTPPIRLSYHHGNHYNSLVDPHRQTVGAGLGFSSLRGVFLISFTIMLA